MATPPATAIAITTAAMIMNVASGGIVDWVEVGELELLVLVATIGSVLHCAKSTFTLLWQMAKLLIPKHEVIPGRVISEHSPCIS